MPSSVPIVRQIAWLSLLPQLAILLILVGVARSMHVPEPLLAGAGVYLLAAASLRSGIPRHHRRGVRLFKRERFAEATPHFLQSYEFFSRHSWLDRWRAVTMCSSSRISYREMGLLNAAFCLAQSGERDRAIAEYRRVLVDFPGSKMAETALRLLVPRPSGALQGAAGDGRNGLA